MKSKINIRVKVIAAVSMLCLMSVFVILFLFTNTFAASVKVPETKIINTESYNSVNIPLDQNANNDKLCVFTKDNYYVFTKYAYNDIPNNSLYATLNANGSGWAEGEENEYYVAVTKEDNAIIESFNGVTAVPDSDGNVILENGGKELELQKIIVVYNKAPRINNVDGNAYNWTKDDVTLVVNAEEEYGGSGLHEEAYSFDNGLTWQASNTKSFSTNQEVKIKVRDKAGNESEVYTVNIDKIDKTAPEIELLSLSDSDGWIICGKKAELRVKVTDVASGINSGSLNVTAPNVSNLQTENQQNGEYKISFYYNGSKYSSNITIKINDNIGNTGTRVISNLIADGGDPHASINNDEISDDWHKGSYTFEFEASDDETAINLSKCRADVENGRVELSLKEGETDKYIAKVIADNGKKINQKITLHIFDKGNNECVVETTKNIKVDNEKPKISDLNVVNKTNPSNSALKNGDTAQISFILDDNEGSGCDNSQIVSVEINGSELKTAQFVDGKFVCDFIIGTDVTLYDNQNIEVTNLEFKDNVGNEVTADEEQSYQTEMKYYADIAISDVKFESDNSNKLVAKNGDRVYVSFSVNHPVDVNGAIMQGSNIRIDEWNKSGFLNVQTNKYDYEGYLTVENLKEFDGQAFKFNFKLTDSAGNEPVLIDETYEDLEPVVYYAPIEDSIVDLKLTSEGINPLCVKNGDEVSFYLKTSHPVEVDNITILGSNIELTTEDKLEWTGTKIIDGSSLSDNSGIEFQLTIRDNAGNTAVTRTHNDADIVKYFDQISIYDLSMTSNNNINSVAKNGNVVETTFKTSHPVKITEGKVAGKNVTFESEDGMNWKGYYTVANGDTVDNGFISLLLKIDDDAENEQLQVTENTSGLQKITYYAPIKVYDVVIKSSNGVDATKYAKNGDVIYVTFKTNHDARITSANIVGKACAQTKNDTSGIEKQWTLTYRINNGDLRDLSVVPFEFKVDDIAGNDPWIQNHTNGVRNRITYYSPITEVTSIASNYRNTDYAKNGDTITVSVRTNHDVSVTESAIFNRAAVNSIVNGNDVRISYTIPQNENGLEQGVVPFRYSLVDPAGNTLTINRTTNTANTVTYDRTRPIVSVTPEFNGFTNKNVSFTFNFSDENLSGNDVSIRVNGVEQISQAERASIGGKTFSKTITLSIENEYEVVATMLDKAGNKCPQDKVAKLTIDKTAPNITSTKIDLTKANNFKSGVKLIDLIDISEEYISEVICTITDSEGTREHDINDPITGDGKKTINLTVKDMAGNVSSTVTFDLYIDGKPPKLVIKNSNSGKQLLSLDKKMTFKSSLKLMIGLDSFENDDTGDLEKFVTLKVLDKKGKVVVDILDECTPLADGNYCVDIDKHGEFTLEVEAVDSVGNSTGLLKYNFEIKEKTLVEKFVSNKILLIGSISAVVILAAVIVILVVRKKRRYYI